MFNLKGKIVVITRPSSGLGDQTARCFDKEGVNLVVMARRIERLRLLQEEVEKLELDI